MKFTNPNFESHPRYLGKTQPPANYVVAQTAIRHLVFTDIPVKQVLVDWTWRNGHAHPTFEHYIPDKPEFIFRDKCLAAYYDRLENVDQIESAAKL